MKNLKFLYFFISIVPLNIIYSQTQQKIEETQTITLENNPLVRIEPSDYLEKHLASKKVPIVKEQAERNLRSLGKILRLYKNEVKEAQKNFDEAADSYKKGIEAYYSGNLLNAFNLFLKSKVISSQLLEEYAAFYKKRSLEIASNIANQLSILESDKINANYFLIHESEHRLNVMKNKILTAEEMLRFKKMVDAIELYKNAKIIGIITLYKLEQDKNKKEQLLQNYKIDLEDANYNIENIRIESF